jgi:pantoate--beta-alanine ligase
MGSPRVLRRAVELRTECDAARARGLRVGFVPTMGALHRGHLDLVRSAGSRASFVVASIFVNPTQFGPNEDLARYPRDLEGDIAKLSSVGTDVVFAPEASEIYPESGDTRVRVSSLADPLCGARRPGHFEGVATVVTKLFGIVGPCMSVFGRKDYQQLLVIRRLVRDLFLPVEVVGHPIVREPDGLAMSSRNAYLSADERARALAIVRGLQEASVQFAMGERDARRLELAARALLETAALSIDYVEVRDAETLALVTRANERALLAVACRVGTTRLIDNVVLGEEPGPLSR